MAKTVKRLISPIPTSKMHGKIMAPSPLQSGLGQVIELLPMNVGGSHVCQFYAWSLKGPVLPFIVSFPPSHVAGNIGAQRNRATQWKERDTLSPTWRGAVQVTPLMSCDEK